MLLQLGFHAVHILLPFDFSAKAVKGFGEAAGPTEQEVPDPDEDPLAGMVMSVSK